MRKISDLKPPMTPRQVKELLSQFKENEGDLPIKKTDVFTRFLFFVATNVAMNSAPNTAKDVGVPSTSGPLEKLAVLPDFISYAPQDEDVPSPLTGADGSSPDPEKVLHMILSAPVKDDFRQWEDLEAAEKVIADRLIGLQPEATEFYFEGERIFRTRLGFAGCGCGKRPAAEGMAGRVGISIGGFSLAASHSPSFSYGEAL
jgi:hypothetical protein